VFRDELNLILSPQPQQGRPTAADIPLTVWLLDLHDNLLSGPTGRRTNAIGAREIRGHGGTESQS
jgi:hypothetical protein